MPTSIVSPPWPANSTCRSAERPPPYSRRSDLRGHPFAAGHRPLHEPLEVRRSVLAGEVDVPLAYALDPTEPGVLPHLILRVGPTGERAQIGVRVPTEPGSPFPG